MSYSQIIIDSKQKVHNQAVAQKIAQLMDDLRLTSNDNFERRWIWELIQNAKDVAFDSQPVSILINFQEEKPGSFLEFKHNGKPFTIDNMTFLIEQLSTKERNAKNGEKNISTGKFGTGFLTTHLLSEKVELKSIAKEPDLPYKNIELSIDRSGRNIDEIIESVNNSLKLLSTLDDEKTITDFDKKKFNTTFRYLLNDEGIEIAKKGLDDLGVLLPFTLAFVPSIKSVIINSETEFIVSPEIIALTDEIEIFNILKKTNDTEKEYYIAVVSNPRISLAIEVEFSPDKISLKQNQSKLPKLFCDFPLIGSEDFNFPVIINSPRFNPTEQRDGVFLTDKGDSKIVENKILLEEAKNLYLKLLEYASLNNWGNMYVLADIDLPKAKNWISREWIKDSVVSPIKDKLLKTPIINTKTFGRIPIECGEFNEFLQKNAIVDFPKHKNQEILQKLYKLCDNQYFIIPVEKDFHYWADIIWDNKYVVDLKSIVSFIENCEELTRLSEKLGKNYEETISWLNMFYSLLVEENEVIKDIHQSKIYPNQNGILKQKEELHFEYGELPETLKDIINDLGNDFRNKLTDNTIDIELPTNNKCDLSSLANEITKLIKPLLQELERTDDTRKIFKQLYLWFIQNKKDAEKTFGSLYENKHKLLDDYEIIQNLEKAESYDSFLTLDPSLSNERIMQLLELEELSKGFNTTKEYTPDEEQKRRNFITGWKGEAFVFKKLNAANLNIEWPNKSNTETQNKIEDFEGEIHYIEDRMQKFDLVVSANNKRSYIQVKSTTTDISRADEIAMPISVREWKFIDEKSDADSYFLARVFNVETDPEVYFMKIENDLK